ncbi:hypothetical protein K439DRAFT_1616768 [Ramaria rubella]|nr:hypothetical protein K439DRAFT_1616768 [Ramaria rubella]
MWTVSGLKVDHALTDVVWAHGSVSALFDHAPFARLAHAYAFTRDSAIIVCGPVMSDYDGASRLQKASEAGHFKAAQARLLHTQLTPPSDPALTSLYSHYLRTPSGPHPSPHRTPGTRISSASASITSIPASAAASHPHPSIPHGAPRIDTWPMEDTSPSRASSLRRAAWAEVLTTSPYDASLWSGSGYGVELGVTASWRLSLRCASMSSPVSHAHVGEGALDDSDPDSLSSGGSGAEREMATGDNGGGGLNNRSGRWSQRRRRRVFRVVLHVQSHGHVREESLDQGRLASGKRRVHGFECGVQMRVGRIEGLSPTHSHAHCPHQPMRASTLEELHHEHDGATSLHPHPSPLPNRSLSLSSLHSLHGPTAPASAPLTHCESHSTIHAVITTAGLRSEGTSRCRRTADVFNGCRGEQRGRVDAASVIAAAQVPCARADAWPIEYGGCAVSEDEWGDLFHNATCRVGVVSSETRVLEIRADGTRLQEIDRTMCRYLGVRTVHAERFVEASVDLGGRANEERLLWEPALGGCLLPPTSRGGTGDRAGFVFSDWLLLVRPGLLVQSAASDGVSSTSTLSA